MYKTLWLPVLLASLLFSCLPEPDPRKQSDTGNAPVAVDTTMANGLHLTDIELGQGPPIRPGDYFTAHYTGYLSDGSIFDSSLERGMPITFQLGAGQVLQAWEEGINGMRTGGKRIIIAPPALAYGENGIPDIIPPDDTLRFEVELVAIHTLPEKWTIDEQSMEVTPDDIRFQVHKSGAGPTVTTGQTVRVHYTGYLPDGTVFDSSFLRDTLFQFQVGVGQVIPGWDLTLLNMQQGEQRTVILPPDLAYGKEGVAGIVPPDSPLRFDIELVEILPPRPVSP